MGARELSYYKEIAPKKLELISKGDTANFSKNASKISLYYFPFACQSVRLGMLACPVHTGLPNRHEAGNEYRYGFNGYEKDDEVSGEGNSLNSFFRQYDSRIGRFKSLDPAAAKFPWMSPYAFANNNPIIYTDVFGGEPENPGDREKRLRAKQAKIFNIKNDKRRIRKQKKVNKKLKELYQSNRWQKWKNKHPFEPRLDKSGGIVDGANNPIKNKFAGIITPDAINYYYGWRAVEITDDDKINVFQIASIGYNEDGIMIPVWSESFVDNHPELDITAGKPIVIGPNGKTILDNSGNVIEMLSLPESVSQSDALYEKGDLRTLDGKTYSGEVKEDEVFRVILDSNGDTKGVINNEKIIENPDKEIKVENNINPD